MKGMGESTFYFSDHMENLLFFKLTISSPAGLIGVCVALVAISVIFESLKFLREYLFVYANEDLYCESQTANETSQLKPHGRRFNKAVRVVFHFLQAFLHMKQIFIGYLIMLCVMSFNAWFFIVTVVGLSLGYFFCGAIFPKNFSTTGSSEANLPTSSYSCATLNSSEN